MAELLDHDLSNRLRLSGKPQEPLGKLWLSDRLEHKRMVLRLVFGGPLPYNRSDGFRSAILTLPFKALAGDTGAEWGLVEPRGIEPLTSTMPL